MEQFESVQHVQHVQYSSSAPWIVAILISAVLWAVIGGVMWYVWTLL